RGLAYLARRLPAGADAHSRRWRAAQRPLSHGRRGQRHALRIGQARCAAGVARRRSARRAPRRRPFAMVVARRAWQALSRHACRWEEDRDEAGAGDRDRAAAANAGAARWRDDDRRTILDTRTSRSPRGPGPVKRTDPRRALPSVDAILRAGRPAANERERFTRAAREVLTRARAERVSGDAATFAAQTRAALVERERLTLRGVIVARGELVEIGGGFRIPDVLRRSGAKLVEVGTTNRTYARDYAAAISQRTGAILRVHASNFKITGFVARAEGRELAALAREHNIAFIHDLGSGTFLDTSRFGLGKELTLSDAIREGADVVTFSGDKLLGGPQAGIAVGEAERIALLRIHPLMRALRPDKLTIAAFLA